MSRDERDGPEESGGVGFIASLPTILWHRRRWLLAPLLLGVLGAVTAIALIPRTYRSTATLVVESPQLPNEITGTLPDNQIDRRIARIREQLISRPDLLALIDSQGLYASERQRMPLSKLIEKMRDAIELTPTMSQTAAGNNGDNVISFELSFDYAQPEQAQAVAQALMERLLDLEASQNQSQANNSVQFLTDQAGSLQTQIRALESQIVGISSKNGRALAAGSMPIMPGGGGGYEVQIATLQRDNAQLLTQRRALQSAGSSDPRVSAAEAALAQARAIYTDSHPDVVFARQRLAEARAQASQDATPSALGEIDQQIASNNGQIATLRASGQAESAQVSASINAQARGPLAQQQISLLQQKLTDLNGQFQEVSRRLLSAKAGVRANEEQLGERLSVIDPPVVPDSPHAPNRLLIAALGIIGGLGGGVILAMLVEALLRPIRTPDDLRAIDGHAPLAIIPLIEFARDTEPAERSRFLRLFSKKKRYAAAAS